MTALRDITQWVAVQALFVWACTEQYLHQAWCWLVERYPNVFAEKTKLIWAKDGDTFKQLEMNGSPLAVSQWPCPDEYDLMLAMVPVPVNPAVVAPTITHYVVRPVNHVDLQAVTTVPKVSKAVRFYKIMINVKPKQATDEHDTETFEIPTTSLQLAVVNNKLFDQPFLAWMLSHLIHRDVTPATHVLHVTFVDNTFKVITLTPGQTVIVFNDEYKIIKGEESLFVGQ